MFKPVWSEALITVNTDLIWLFAFKNKTHLNFAKQESSEVAGDASFECLFAKQLTKYVYLTVRLMIKVCHRVPVRMTCVSSCSVMLPLSYPSCSSMFTDRDTGNYRIWSSQV